MSKDSSDYSRDYTKPKLRERLKDQIKQSDRGGAPGQWSARKSQLLKREYEDQGGDYRHPERPTAGQQSLHEWSQQDWQTAEGSRQARHDGKTERYLPEQAWEELSQDEREQTQRRKRQASRQGRQRSTNPPAAKSARKVAELDTMSASAAVKHARNLSPDEASQALQHETEHRNRKTVKRQLERAAKR